MKFMPHADDTIWLFFALGLAIIAADAVMYLGFKLNGWAALGFLITGILVSASFYVVGTHPPLCAAPTKQEGSVVSGPGREGARAFSDGRVWRW